MPGSVDSVTRVTDRQASTGLDRRREYRDSPRAGRSIPVLQRQGDSRVTSSVGPTATARTRDTPRADVGSGYPAYGAEPRLQRSMLTLPIGTSARLRPPRIRQPARGGRQHAVGRWRVRSSSETPELGRFADRGSSIGGAGGVDAAGVGLRSRTRLPRFHVHIYVDSHGTPPMPADKASRPTSPRRTPAIGDRARLHRVRPHDVGPPAGVRVCHQLHGRSVLFE